MNLNVDQYLTENQGIVALLATLGAKENKDQMYFILCVNGTSRFLWGSSVFSLWPKVPGSFRTYVGLESCQACCYLGGSVVIGPSTNAFLVNLEKQPLSIHEQEKNSIARSCWWLKLLSVFRNRTCSAAQTPSAELWEVLPF